MNSLHCGIFHARDEQSTSNAPHSPSPSNQQTLSLFCFPPAHLLNCLDSLYPGARWGSPQATAHSCSKPRSGAPRRASSGLIPPSRWIEDIRAEEPGRLARVGSRSLPFAASRLAAQGSRCHTTSRADRLASPPRSTARRPPRRPQRGGVRPPCGAPKCSHSDGVAESHSREK